MQYLKPTYPFFSFGKYIFNFLTKVTHKICVIRQVVLATSLVSAASRQIGPQ